MTPCSKPIQPMPNVPLAYVSVHVCQRMSDIFHTLAYASTIRYTLIIGNFAQLQITNVTSLCLAITHPQNHISYILIVA